MDSPLDRVLLRLILVFFFLLYFFFHVILNFDFTFKKMLISQMR